MHVDTTMKLAHYGVPGMRWGQRKSPGTRAAPAMKRPKSPDFLDSRELKKKKVSELSNDELQRLTKRMDLEAKYNKINPSRLERGQKVIKRLLAVGETANSVVKFMNSDVGRKMMARGQAALQARAVTTK